MKKFLKACILMLTVAFLMVSCQQEDHSTFVNPETLNASSDLSNRLNQVTAAGDSIPSDNVLDSTNCFKIKLPVEVTANGQDLLIQNEQDYDLVHAIFTASDTDDDHIEFAFPITIIYPNNEELMVGNQQQFELLQGNCPTLGSDCIHLVYPVSVSAYNTDFQQQMTYTFNDDAEMHQFLLGLAPADTYTINYPIGIVVNNEPITVNNNAQLLDVIVDGLVDCGIVPNPCANANVLTNGLIMYIPFANQIVDLTGFGNPTPGDSNYSFVTDRSGNPNGAFSFNTADATSFIQLTGNDNNNLLQSGGFTISFWFNRQNTDPTEFEKLYNNSQMQISLGNQINPQIRSPFVLANGMTEPIYDTDWIANNLLGEINQWHHLVVTYNGEIMYLYRDGVLQSGSSTVVFDGPLGGGLIGDGYKGFIDDIRMYNRVLDNNEINILRQLEGDINTCVN